MSRSSKFAKVGAVALIQIIWASVAHAADTSYELKPISLPGATGAIALDYFAYDRATGKLWVPASNTGSVDVIDDKTDSVSQISGFPTGEIERRGRKITVGPTAASIGDGVVYIGNRGTATLCVIDPQPLDRGECFPASSDHSVTPDGVVYVAKTKELWVTTRPVSSATVDAAKALQVFDASDPRHLKWKTKIPLENLAEGYAVDNEHGLFFTNVEETGSTVAIDVQKHKIAAKYHPGSSDLQGFALDNTRRFLFVACGDHVVSIDAAHDGKILDSLATGAGSDNIDYSPDAEILHAAASPAGTLTVAEVGDDAHFPL